MVADISGLGGGSGYDRETERAGSGSPAARASGKGPVRAGTVEQPSRADRVAQGKDARAVAPLESHAEFVPPGSRDPVGLLLGQAKSRVPELVPVRQGRSHHRHLRPGPRSAHPNPSSETRKARHG
jgi:hypothetical protein